MLSLDGCVGTLPEGVAQQAAWSELRLLSLSRSQTWQSLLSLHVCRIMISAIPVMRLGVHSA